MTRRAFMVGLPLALAACTTVPLVPPVDLVATLYGPLPDEEFPIPAVDPRYINPAYYRTSVLTPTSFTQGPGEIVVDPRNKYLYFLQADGSSLRYGVGVGREGFGWSGTARIDRKAEWPTWTPPAAMVARDPAARPWANGMPGGLDNPLGARAHYLYQGGRDTLYRIHGTNAPWTIGSDVSSGCIRMINQDVIDLYGRVPIGTRVTVLAV
ncbi:MAG: L,D-transpeptidase [Bauldia sp.]|nr:L,D-transpeptidase [Bauldia sp.]